MLIDKKIIKHYEKDFTYEQTATRYLNDVWLSWLRLYHSATKDEAIEFARIVQEVTPHLVGVSQPIPKGYLQPFAMKTLCFEQEKS